MPPPLRARLHATFACVATLALWLWRGGVLAGTLALLAAALALLAWLAPAGYAPVQRGLDRFARSIVVGCTWAALGLVYFGVFTPLRLWRDLRGVDPLTRKQAPAGRSYLRPLSPTPSRFERQF